MGERRGGVLDERSFGRGVLEERREEELRGD